MSKHERNIPAQSRSRQRVEKILDAAAIVMAEKGYDGATLREVAKQADVKQTSLYRYWPNKQAIVSDLIDRFITGQNEVIDACYEMGRQGDSWEEIISLFINKLRTTVETERWIPACQIALISDPDMKSKDQFVQNHFTKRLGHLMSENGVGNDDGTGEQVGRMMAVLLDGFVQSLGRHAKPGHDVIEAEFNRTLSSYLAPYVLDGSPDLQ